MPGTLPTGIGNDQQASQATAFIRQQPWYLDWLAQQGIQPGPDQQVKLNDKQQLGLNQLVRQHGIGMNNKYDGIDENGQIYEEHHKLKKIAIAAAIGGLALTGLGAAGIGPMSGLFGAALPATTTGASMTGLGAGAGALVPATTSSLAALGGSAGILGGAGAAGVGAGAAGGTLAALGSSAIPGMAGIGAGVGSLVPATTGIATGMGVGGAAGAGAGLSSMTGGSSSGAGLVGGTAGPLSSTPVGSGMIGPITGGTSGSGLGAVGGSTAGLGGAGSTLSKLGSGADKFADIGKTLEAYATDAQGNRVLQGNFAQAYDKNMLDAQAARNLNETDAQNKLHQTAYTMGGGAPYQASTYQLNGKPTTTQSFGLGPKAPTDIEKQGAKALQDQLVARLGPGGSYTPQPLSSYATPQTGENVSSKIGAGLGIAGSVLGMFR